MMTGEEFLKDMFIQDKVDKWKPDNLMAIGTFMDTYALYISGELLEEVKRLKDLNETLNKEKLKTSGREN